MGLIRKQVTSRGAAVNDFMQTVCQAAMAMADHEGNPDSWKEACLKAAAGISVAYQGSRLIKPQLAIILPSSSTPSPNGSFGTGESEKLYFELLAAAYYGDVDAAKAVLERGVDVNLCNPQLGPVLLAAVWKGEVEMVQFLLKCGAQPNTIGHSGTLLAMAAYNGHLAISRLLLDSGAKVNLRGPRGNVPIIIAVEMGFYSLSKLLLDRGAEVNSVTSSGQVPLMIATQKRRGDMVRMLLRREDIDPNSVDHRGLTALHYAAREDVVSVAKVLMKHEGTDPNVKDTMGATPLSYAVECGSWHVLIFLLSCKGINLNFDDKDSCPLCCAARLGERAILEFLLEKYSIEPEHYTVLLNLAISCAQMDLVKLLLNRAELDVNFHSPSCAPPLVTAVRAEVISVVNLLLQRPDTDPNVLHTENVWYGSTSTTPLHYAARAGDYEIVQALLRHPKIDPSIRDQSGRTPLRAAADVHQGGMMRMLLQHGWENGESPESVVSQLGFVEDRFFMGTQSTMWQVPFVWAAEHGYQELLDLLLGIEHVDINGTDDNNETALCAAARTGQVGIVQRLIDQHDIEINLVEEDLGETPLWLAVTNRHVQIARILEANGGLMSADSDLANGGEEDDEQGDEDQENDEQS